MDGTSDRHELSGPRSQRRVARWLRWAAAIAVGGALAGCSMDKMRGPGFDKGPGAVQWDGRPKSARVPGEKPWGFDSRAREIERSLGVE